MEKNVSIKKQLDFLSGGGDMGERIRNFDWGSTPLGDPETWEQGLKTCVRIILTSAQPMLFGGDLHLLIFTTINMRIFWVLNIQPR